jgi:hypothetical protein
MIAHGANPDNLDEQTFREICVMYSDGLIGNGLMIETLGNLTAGVYNYMRSSSSQAYTLRNIIGRSYEYLYPPQDTTKSVNESLLAYVSQAKGFNPNRFKVK